jgi:hypothetical protein
VHHRCGHKLCVNPAHLELLSAEAHSRRHHGSPKSHCKYGHAMTPDNVMVVGAGRPRCRACNHAYFKRWYYERGGRERQTISGGRAWRQPKGEVSSSGVRVPPAPEGSR